MFWSTLAVSGVTEILGPEVAELFATTEMAGLTSVACGTKLDTVVVEEELEDGDNARYAPAPAAKMATIMMTAATCLASLLRVSDPVRETVT